MPRNYINLLSVLLKFSKIIPAWLYFFMISKNDYSGTTDIQENIHSKTYLYRNPFTYFLDLNLFPKYC